jgi:putative ABC transport system permease protein
LPYTVIGIVGDTRDQHLREAPSPQIYLDYRQSTPAEFNIVVRGPSGGGIAAAVRRELTALEPLLPARESIQLSRVLDDDAAADRFVARLVAAFAVLSLLLAAVGIYGTTAEAVSTRTREMGVRLALGALPHDVRALVLREAGLVLGAAVAAAIPIAWAGAQTMRGILYQVGTADPITYLLAIATAGATALVACYIPARRASRVDPLVALRGE